MGRGRKRDGGVRRFVGAGSCNTICGMGGDAHAKMRLFQDLLGDTT
jgi:hypothetical protein